MKMELRGKKIATALLKAIVDSTAKDEAIAPTISGFEDNTLRAVQSCITAKNECEELQIRCAGKTVNDKLSLLNGLLNVGMKRED